METEKRSTLVVGTGLAGLFFALKYAQNNAVTVISKVSLEATNTSMAQGGVAAAIADSDSAEKHAEDTLQAGAGLCHPGVVREVTRMAPERIQDLVDWGVRFDMETTDHGFRLGKEGGHQERRILHISDHTGQSIHAHLLAQAKSHPNIELIENTFAVDLIQEKHFTGQHSCRGVIVLEKPTQALKALFADHVVLATGGAGKTYRFTSNWEGATGDGIALAARAGARVANMEFMQFHPTCLYHHDSRNFLISEALRGEGGVLRNQAGEDFVQAVHPLASLAPRDIVARAIDSEMKKTGAECVHLDMTHQSRDYLNERFPVIFQKCLKLGIDISSMPIPVVPAAHYLCGGVVTNLNGQTSIQNLYGLGETACTGLHGANRLASNSLLECMITSHRCAEWISKNQSDGLQSSHPIPYERSFSSHSDDEMVVIHHMWDEIRTLMWNYVGIVRSNRRLKRAAHRLELIQQEIQEYYSDFTPHSDIEELRNIALVADLTVKSALRRKESRGVHYSLDYPDLGPEPAQDTILDGMT